MNGLKNLPIQYHQLEYITLQNNAYIELDFNNLDQQYIVDCDLEVDTLSSGKFLYGQQLSNDTMINGLQYISDNTFKLWYGDSTWTFCIKTSPSKRITINQRRATPETPSDIGDQVWDSGYNGYITPNGIRTLVFNALPNEQAENLYTQCKDFDRKTNGNRKPFYIGAYKNSGGTIQKYGKLKVYHFRIKAQAPTSLYDQVYVELIPCINTLTLEAGLYDIVNDVFYGNANSSGLISGQDSSDNSILAEGLLKKHKFILSGLIPSEYTPVEYIEVTGDADINLKVKFNNVDKYPIKCIFECSVVSTNQQGYLNAPLLSSSNSWRGPILLNFAANKLEFGTNECYPSATYTPNSKFKCEFNSLNGDQTWKKDGINVANRNQSAIISANYVQLFHMSEYDVEDDEYSHYYFRGKLYSLKLYSAGKLIRDLVPVFYLDSGTRIYGLYDIISKKYFGTSGDPSAITGPASAVGTLQPRVYEINYESNNEISEVDALRTKYERRTYTRWTNKSLLEFEPILGIGNEGNGDFAYIVNWDELERILDREGLTVNDIDVGAVVQKHSNHYFRKTAKFRQSMAYNYLKHGDGRKATIISWSRGFGHINKAAPYEFSISNSGSLNNFLEFVKHSFPRKKASQTGSYYYTNSDNTKFFFSENDIGLVLAYKNRTDKFNEHSKISPNYIYTRDDDTGNAQYGISTGNNWYGFEF